MDAGTERKIVKLFQTGGNSRRGNARGAINVKRLCKMNCATEGDKILGFHVLFRVVMIVFLFYSG